MPNQYKEKQCPVCNQSHRKRGAYCCQSCANSNQSKSPEHVKKIKKSIAEYQNSPEGVANAQRQSVRASAMRTGAELPVTLEDFCVDLPDIREMPDLDGYDKAENW